MSDIIAKTRRQADEALRAGQLTTSLRGFTQLLRADPEDRFAWYRVATLLGRSAGAEGQDTLSQACLGIARGGRLVLAIAAQRELARLAPDAARGCATEIGGLFGSGSARLAKGRQAVPPPPPRAVHSASLASASEDPRVLREEAVDACAEAAARAATKHNELPFHPLLSELPAPDLAQLIELATVEDHAAGEVILAEGSEARTIFIVAAGELEVVREETHLATLHRGAIFGEMALLTGAPRTATVRAASACVLLAIGREAVEGLAGRNPAVAGVLAGYTRRRLLRNVMVTSPLFAKVPAARREGLVALFTPAVYEPAETVIAQGEPSAGLHVVLSGMVLVSQREGGEVLRLGELGSGQVFGEISLIQRTPATASVTAVNKAVVLCLERQTFNAHVDDYPEVLAHVYRLAQERQDNNLQSSGAEALMVDDDDLLF